MTPILPELRRVFICLQSDDLFQMAKTVAVVGFGVGTTDGDAGGFFHIWPQTACLKYILNYATWPSESDPIRRRPSYKILAEKALHAQGISLIFKNGPKTTNMQLFVTNSGDTLWKSAA